MAMVREDDEVYQTSTGMIVSTDRVKTTTAIVPVRDETTTGIPVEGITTVDIKMEDMTIATDRLASAIRKMTMADLVVLHMTSTSLLSSSKVEV